VTGGLAHFDVASAGERLRSRELSPVELTRAALDRLEAAEPTVSAFALTLPEQAIAEARAAEAELTSGRSRGPLHGIPVGVKDLFDTAGIPTEGGSRAYAGRVPATDAACVARLREAGAVLLGKTHTHELAYGVTTPATHNPWSLGHVAGGSSGGSAAAVAAGECLLALGTDTGGSIRIPSACCGVTGLKPTYGRVSKTGVMPLSTSLDHAGPIGRSVRDVALALSVLAGHDPRDPSAAPVAVDDYLRDLDSGVAGLTIGVLTGHYRSAIDPEVESAVEAAIPVLEDEGATVRELELPLAEHAAAVLFAICLREAADVHAEAVRERADALGDDVRLYLELGALRPPAEHERAVRVRERMRRAWRDAFAGFDAAIAPTLPATAAPADADTLPLPDGPEGVVPAYLRLCAPANAVGLPALSLPCGFDGAGLPIGLQLIGRPFGEATLLRIGSAYQRVTDWHLRRPPEPFQP
jgi:aspartyl-tRNA(Asn)/glutamyl-tRNA(Gln) amidotransferase subunit A